MVNVNDQEHIAFSDPQNELEDTITEEDFRKELIQLQERTGYEIIYLKSEESKVELLSVDKATIVEDIQKYIDLQSIKEK